MKLEYKFRDNESIISFDVNNNSVLYGMNGSGKTRVLKSLSAVSNIGKIIEGLLIFLRNII